MLMSLLRQGREPVLLSFARSHGDLFHLQIHILDPQSDRFHNAQSAAIEKRHDQLPHALHQGDHFRHLRAAQHNGQVDFAFRPHRLDRPAQRHLQHALVKKHQRVHRLILRRG